MKNTELITGSDVQIKKLPHIKREFRGSYGIVTKWHPNPYSYTVLVNGVACLLYPDELIPHS